MHRKLGILWGKWYWTVASAIVIALLGAGSAWWQDRHDDRQVRPAATQRAGTYAEFPFAPNSFRSMSGFVTGANGPLEPPERKALRLAEEARIATRLLVKPDRSNVDCRQMRCIAITYDDGPEPGLTLQLVNMLEERQAVATFFVLGSRVAGQTDTLKTIVQKQNEIGNHTWSHPNLRLLRDEDIAAELRATGDVIAQAAGQRPRFMRPPMGEYDGRVAVAAQMPLALWTVDPKDWLDPDPKMIYQRVMHGAGRGKVILLHDTKLATVQATPRIIDELQRQGYVLVTMSELFGVTDVNAGQFAGKILRYK